MLGFGWWWAMLLLPLPLLARKFLPLANRTDLALAVPLLDRFPFTTSSIRQSPRQIARACAWLFWICLVIAASRPFWLGEPVSRTVSGRDLMLAVDISGSMSEVDMTINSKAASRLDVLKAVVGKFIDRREGDRLGLILFGTNAYTYVPLTFDLDTLQQLLADVSTGLAGRYTAIGDAIGLAVKSTRAQGSAHKVLILVTDGSNTAGFENPVVAARLARQQGLTIYTIGVGSKGLVPFWEDGRMTQQRMEIDEELLGEVATATGGAYFRATDTDALEEIYERIDALEKTEAESRSTWVPTPLYRWPLGIALAALLLLGLFPDGNWRRLARNTT